MRTSEEIAAEVLRETSGFPVNPSGPDLRSLMTRAIKADRAQRETAPRYKVGDPDPTPDDTGEADWCRSEHGGYSCTWDRGHGGQHVSGTGHEEGEIVAVWDNEEEES